MLTVTRTALTAVLLVSLPSGLSAQPLSQEEKEKLINDPEARQEALSLINSISKERVASAQLKSKANNKKVSPTQKSAGGNPTSKQPDAITQLLQSNEHKAPTERQYSPCAGWNFIVRQSWKDLGNAAGAACPDAAAKAQGAQVSFANDLAANNRVVTINGTAAVLYNSITGDVPAPMPYAVSVGAYTTVDDVSNSATSQMKSNVDTLAYGGLLNLGYSTSTGGNYFMLRGGIIEDFVKNTTAGNAVLDWSPVVYPLYIHYPYHFASLGLPIITRFDPDLVARFDSATGRNQLLAFNNMHDSLRLGPELALTIVPDPGYISGPLSRFTALLGYDIWYETYSKKELTWFTSSLTYNLDEAGNFGIQGTYNQGRDVNTGKWANIYTIGLSGKI
jgi:hypothetical protein